MEERFTVHVLNKHGFTMNTADIEPLLLFDAKKKANEYLGEWKMPNSHRVVIRNNQHVCVWMRFVPKATEVANV